MKIYFIRLLFVAIAITQSACGGGGGGSSVSDNSNANTGGPVPFSAKANSNTQVLVVGTAMPDFTPLSVSGGKTPYTFSYTGKLPKGLNFDSGSGVLSGTPLLTYSTADLVFYVTDADKIGASTTNRVHVTVNDADGTPAISAIADTTPQVLAVGTAMTDFLPLAVGGGSVPYTYSFSGSLPSGLNFDSGTGVVSGTPNITYSTASVVFSVKDKNGVKATTTSSIRFTVNAADGTPAISATADSTVQNLTVNLPMTDFKPLTPADGMPGYTYSYSGTLPTGLSFDPTTGIISGTPTATYETAYIIFSVVDSAGAVASTTSNVLFTVNTPPLNLLSGQAANLVVGQNDFKSKTTYFGTMGNGAAGLNGPWGSVFINAGNLYIADYENNRVMVFNNLPVINGASADYALGQTDMMSVSYGTSATKLNGALGPMVSGGKLFLPDYVNNRIAVYNTVPTSSTDSMDVVVGQENKQSSRSGGCNPRGLSNPAAVWAAANKMVVADENNNRVLIWNSVPSNDNTPADLVLGQANMVSCAANRAGSVGANTLNGPSAVWTDGTRLVIVDTNNNRTLIWNSFPGSNGQAADIVLGQADFTHKSVNQGGVASAVTLNYPWGGVFVHNAQLFIADGSNNRVLVWDSFPINNDQPANQVVGQQNFVATAAGTSSTTLDTPTGVFVYENKLFISDTGNNRVLIYNGY